MNARLFTLIILAALVPISIRAAEKPNILVILADDLGYADVGFQGCKDIPTPNLDKLAKRSLRCTNAYVTHPFCSPTRAGLLTGRYQQHFGHENNPVWNPEDTVSGLPLTQVTLPQVLKTAGYVTGAVGKWHLGAHPQFHPNRRGFDEYVGFLGGGHIYLPGEKGGVEYNLPIDRNGTPEPLKEYITDFFGHEASAFITRHKSEPWFLYVAFNAPHTPLQATEKQLSRVSGITDEIRRKYGGLVVGLDDAMGEVLATLRDSGQDEKTLVFFMSDNGGPVGVTHSDNAPLRGAKGQVFEGGIRVPFLVSWPGRLAQGKDYALPISSLDVFATAVALTGAKVPETHHLDGVNILPFLAGEKTGAAHEHLFWRTANGTWAVREGNWKLLNMNNGKDQCFDLGGDIAEASDVAAEKPDVTAKLKNSYAAWNAENITPVFSGPAAVRAKKRRRRSKCVAATPVDIATATATLALLFHQTNPTMANTKSAAKRARQSERRTNVNRRALTAVKNQLKKFRTVVAGTDKAAAKAAAVEFISTIDKAAKTGRVHQNAANRQKSAVHKALAKLA